MLRRLLINYRQSSTGEVLLSGVADRNEMKLNLCGGFVVGSSGVGCGKGLAVHSRNNNPHLVLPPLFNLTTKTATLLVGLWCKCGGVATTCPELGHTRATLLPHSDHTVWWKCGGTESIGIRRIQLA